MLKADMTADLAIWSVERPAELSYWFGGNPCAGIIKTGNWVKRCV
jgi:imidazolonepropionase-like amidohydrolase